MDVPFDVRVDWLAAYSHEQGYNEYNDDEIVELAKGKGSEEEVSIDIPISHNQACNVIETLLRYLEQQSDVPFTVEHQLSELHLSKKLKKTSVIQTADYSTT